MSVLNWLKQAAASTGLRALSLALTFMLLFSSGGNAPFVDKAEAATNMQVHFIDVGQGDSILIQLPNGQNMLIDAGDNTKGTTVVNYIKGKGITRLDYVIGTHPDEDHIGGLDTVINSLSIGSVYMPSKTSTTITYNDVLKAIQNKGLTVKTAKAGVTLLNTTANSLALKAVMIAPVATSYSSTNDYSAVIRMTYGSTNFLFTGDAEVKSETDIINSGQTLTANILKVGHHGSNTSSSDAFLNKVNASVAVIQCGLNNSYGHPTQSTIDKLKARGMKIYRTDLGGSIIFTTSGSGWLVNKAPWWQP